MESNNPLPPTGWPYLRSKAGALNILEVVLNITSSIIFANLIGFSIKANAYCTVVVLATIYTIAITVLHILGTTRRTKLPWHWIECVSVLTIAVLLVVFSSITMATFTKRFVISGIVGYITAAIYFLDTFDKYKIAITPAPKYAWTTPNMPDLN